MIKKILSVVFIFLSSATYTLAQMPTHIDPGQSDDAKRLTDKPEYIILFVALIVLLVLLFFWLRRRK